MTDSARHDIDHAIAANRRMLRRLGPAHTSIEDILQTRARALIRSADETGDSCESVSMTITLRASSAATAPRLAATIAAIRELSPEIVSIR